MGLAALAVLCLGATVSWDAPDPAQGVQDAVLCMGLDPEALICTIVPVSTCGARCEATINVPEPTVGEVLYFMLYHARSDGCASLTAWPPP